MLQGTQPRAGVPCRSSDPGLSLRQREKPDFRGATLSILKGRSVRMRSIGIKKVRLILTGLVVAALAGWIFISFQRAPRYEGRTAGYWVQELPRDAFHARRALRQLGSAAVPSLTRAVEIKQSRLVPWLDSLRRHIPVFLRRYLPSSAEVSVRGDRAVETLYDLGPSAAPAVPALIREELNHSVLDFNHAHAALLRIGEAGVPQFVRVLRRGDSRERVAAARYLKGIGPAAGLAGAALAEAARGPDDLVRTEALVALAQIGPAARNALPALRTLPGRCDDTSQCRAIEALWKVGGDSDSTVPLLIQMLQDRSNPNRADAAALLGDMGAAAAPALPVLSNVVCEEFSYTRVKAEESLRQIRVSMKAAGTGQ